MWKIVLSGMMILALVACQKSAPSGEAQPGAAPLQKTSVAYTSQPQSTLIHVAVAKGYFAEQGLEVELAMFSYGKAALQLVLENKADFATVAETPIMFSVLKGDKIFVIAHIESSSSNNAVVARKEAGISVLGDLKGKRIGFTPGTTSDFFLDSLLATQGITRQDIQPIALNPEEMLQAVVTAKVDAVSIWNYPLTLIKEQLGAGWGVFYDRQIYTETFNIAVQQAFVQKNPETVKRFLRALIKAEEFVANNPQETQSILSAATKIDLRLIRAVWNNFNYRVVLDKALVIALEDETRWAMKNKMTDQTVMPDYTRYIHTESLKAVKPEAVHSIR